MFMFISLYADPKSTLSLRVRYTMAEKKLQYKLVEVDDIAQLPELREQVPRATLPVLKERESVIYDPNIIMYYVDERYPAPPLMSTYPVLRAKTRLTITRIDKDWYSLYRLAAQGTDKAPEACSALKDSFKALSQIFAETPYFMSDEITLADCALTALLWYLPTIGIDLTEDLGAVQDYAKRMFERDAFQKSLSREERKIRQPLLQ